MPMMRPVRESVERGFTAEEVNAMGLHEAVLLTTNTGCDIILLI